jgi:hypothetical protein
VVAHGKKRQAALFGTKDKSEIDTCAAFEIVFPKPANAQTGVKMRLPETVVD